MAVSRKCASKAAAGVGSACSSQTPSSPISAGVFAGFGKTTTEPATRQPAVDAGNVRLAARDDASMELAHDCLVDGQGARRGLAHPQDRAIVIDGFEMFVQGFAPDGDAMLDDFRRFPKLNINA